MPGIVTQRDIASLGALKRLSAAASATAGSTGDSTTTTGVTIDRASAFSNGSMPDSLSAAIIWEAVLQTGKTLSIGYAVQDSADGSSWADYQTATYAVVATGSTGASAVAGQLEVAVNLGSARQYVRINSAPDLSATATDTAVTRAVGFFAGFDRLAQ